MNKEETKRLTKGLSNETNQTRTLDLVNENDPIEYYPKPENCLNTSEKEEAESLILAVELS